MQNTLAIFVIIASVIALELPSTVTRIYLDMASKSSTAKQGISWLRKHGNREVMLRACYERSGKATDIIGSLYECANKMDVDTARSLYYKVTGKPFNSEPIPLSARAAMQHARVAVNGALITDEFDVDTDIAGESVSGISRGLSGDKSELKGYVYPNGLADLHWTIGLKNVSKYDREARVKILLPPGAVVNQAYLVIDGKELTSKISLRQEARAQYQESISTGSDPLLVSYCGVDQILVQCYPVRPHSKMEVTIGIAAPIIANSAGAGISPSYGSLVLPIFEERNFPVDVPESVDIYSPEAFVTTNDDSDRPVHQVTKLLKPRTDESEPAVLKVAINKQLIDSSLWCPIEHYGVNIEQKLEALSLSPPSKLVVVLDGSASMAPYKEALLEALHKVPSSIPTSVVTAADASSPDLTPFIRSLTNRESSTSNFVCEELLQSAISDLNIAQFEGGQDNSTQLEYACTECAKVPRASVLWIHGNQPISKEYGELAELLNQRRDQPLLYDFQVDFGPDEILNNVNEGNGYERVTRTGSVKEDLTRVFDQWNQKSKSFVEVRTGDIQYSDHQAPLRWPTN